MRLVQTFKVAALLIFTNKEAEGAVFSSARAGQSYRNEQSLLFLHNEDENGQSQRRASGDDDLTPDFAPPQENRPPVDYGGRHPNEDNYIPQENCYAPLRIELATHQLEELKVSVPALASRVDALIHHILPGVTEEWSKALSVIPVLGNLVHQSSTCGDVVVPEPFQTVGVPDTDLIVYVVGAQHGDSSCSETTLAYAGPCEYDQHFRPVAGRAVVCIENILLDETGSVPPGEIEFQTSILIHEFAHILGASSGMMGYYKDENFVEYGSIFETDVECVDGSVRNISVPAILNQVSEPGEPAYFEVVSPKVRRVVQNHFNCMSLNGARLENQPSTPTCFGDHFEERIFHGECLSRIAASTGNIALTPLKLALLEDSSWYKPNYKESSNSPFGHGAGCSFVEDKCIVDGEVPDYSRGYFCNEKIPWAGAFLGDEDEVHYGCNPSHEQKAVCDLIDYSEEILGLLEAPPPEFQNFPNPSYGSYYVQESDFCPIKHLYAIDCADSSLQADAVFGETYGDNSKCFETTSGNSLCLETLCDHVNHRVDVVVNGEIHQCDDDFQVLIIPWMPPIECPRFASICPSFICPSACSGRGRCDYEAQPPKCICDDPNDQSEGCYEVLPTCPFSKVTSLFPSSSPSISPSISYVPSQTLSTSPTISASSHPSMSLSPSRSPVVESPTTNPSRSAEPSAMPSLFPVSIPSETPTLSAMPTSSHSPTMTTSSEPSSSQYPTYTPSSFPTMKTSNPTGRPTTGQVFTSAPPTPSPDVIGEASECFTDWKILESSIEGSSGGTFVICPDTILYPGSSDFSAISFPKNSDCVVLCGVDGNSKNNCTVIGGTTHFVISDSTISVTMRGLEMRDAVETSILAHGGEGATASFYDCTWKHNYGDFGGAVDLWTRSNKAMTAHFEKCYFTENESDFGAVNIEAGHVTFNICHFLSNISYETISGSAISVRQEHGIRGQVNIIDTCFTYNNAVKGYGTVFIEEETTSGNVYEGNHGAENVAGGSNGCTGIYEEEGNNCVQIPQ